MTFHLKTPTLLMRTSLGILLLALSLQGNAASVSQNASQSIDEIHRLVMTYLKNKVQRQPLQDIFEPEYSLRELSASLRLAPCQIPLELNDRNPDDYLGRMTIGVSCASPKWQVYIPAEIDGKTKVVVTTRALTKRSTIQAEDIREILMPYRSAPHGIVSNAKNALGMRTKSAIGAHQPLKIRDLQPAFWVFKNRRVNLLTTIGTVEVATEGLAQSDAVKDEQIAVKNLSSGKIVKGIVIAPNTVYVP